MNKLTPIGAERDSAARCQTGEAGAPNLSTYCCPACEGSGEEYFIALDGRDYELGDCTTCEGTGEVDYETPSPRSTLTMEQVEAQIAEAFGLTGWARAEAAAVGGR